MRRHVPWIAWAVSSLLLTALSHGCIPTSKRLTGPFACPSGTTQYVVHRYMSRNNNNKTSETSDLICLDADGGGTRANSFVTIGVGFGYTGLLLAIPLVVFGLRGRGRGRDKARAS